MQDYNKLIQSSVQGNKMDLPDIDIDTGDRNKILEQMVYINASKVKGNKIEKHLTGVYVQDINADKITGTATIDYKEAESFGFMKLDILNNVVYQQIKSRAELIQLMEKEPQWDILLDPEKIKSLYHVSEHHEILKLMKPQSTEQLAMVLALIRPGKRYLIGNSWEEIESKIWIKTDQYAFKKSHAIAFALLIQVQMNLISS